MHHTFTPLDLNILPFKKHYPFSPETYLCYRIGVRTLRYVLKTYKNGGVLSNKKPKIPFHGDSAFSFLCASIKFTFVCFKFDN
jgi:hypothetical protein